MKIPYHARAWFNGLPEIIKKFSEWERLSEDQWIAVWRCCDSNASRCLALTGKSGSGKSFCIKLIHKILSALRKEVILLGSTGVARQNINGEATIHKFGFLGIGEYLPIGLKDPLEKGVRSRSGIEGSGKKLAERFRKTTGEIVIVIDEISMASSELLILFYQALSLGLKGRYFRFICVGDFRQLEPVGGESNDKSWKGCNDLAFEDAVFYVGEEEHRYSSLLSTRGPFSLRDLPEEWSYESISLLTNHRQNLSEYKFIEGLNALGEGSDFQDPKLQVFLNCTYENSNGSYVNILCKDKILKAEEIENSLRVCFTNNEVKQFNEIKLREFASRGAARQVYKGKLIARSWNERQIEAELYPVERNCELYTGMKFMVRCNINEFLANGTVGTIFQLDKESIRLKLEDGTKATLKRTVFPLPKDSSGASVGHFETVAAGHLAYASTAWKCQGLTIKKFSSEEIATLGENYKGDDKLVLVISRPLAQHGLLYTVCSRVQSLEQLIILPKKLGYLSAMAVVNPKIAEFIADAEQNMQRWLYQIELSSTFTITVQDSSLAHAQTESELKDLGTKVYIWEFDGKKYSVVGGELWVLCIEGNAMRVADPVLKQHIEEKQEELII